MKQKSEHTLLVLPEERPKTIRALHKWHRDLLEKCLHFEFEKRALEAGIRRINGEIQKYVTWLRDDSQYGPAVLLALRELNRLKGEWHAELSVDKAAIRALHDTNAMIVALVLRSGGAEQIIHDVDEGQVPDTGNLLHEPGWLTELEAAEDLEKEGYAAFLTFGTKFDARAIDIVAVPKPRRRIRWRGRWPPAGWKRSRVG